MFWNAKNGAVELGGTDMDYIRFGSGINHLVILPGLGDGLQTVKGTAVPMAVTYRSFAKDYTVWVFSRKNGLSVGCTTRDMARDREIAAQIPGAKLRMYAQWGHGVYEEARDFNRTVLDFLNSK